jgi:hypothetical protein
VEINGIVMSEGEIQDAIDKLEKIKNGIRSEGITPNGVRGIPSRSHDNVVPSF